MLFVKCALLLAAIFFGQTAAGLFDPSSMLHKRDDFHTSSLTAVNVQSELERREVSFDPRHTCEHHYVDRMSSCYQNLSLR
jgi:hypothetical protein